MLSLYDLFWIPVLKGYIDYTDACKLHEHELVEFNMAIKRYEG